MHDSNEDGAEQKTRRTNGVRIVLIILAAIVFGVVGAVIGLLAGAAYGGNFATDFQFAGNRGYEACGLLGALVGLPLGSMGGALLAACLLRK